jgi:hypothetical protein
LFMAISRARRFCNGPNFPLPRTNYARCFFDPTESTLNLATDPPKGSSH